MAHRQYKNTTRISLQTQHSTEKVIVNVPHLDLRKKCKYMYKL